MSRLFRLLLYTYLSFSTTTLIVRQAAAQSDPLPSWNDTAAKKNIESFVDRVTKEGGRDFVRPAERIATFDNDGTLWVESPVYTQVVFAFDRIKEMAPQHPEWKTKQPFKGVLEGDMKAVAATGQQGVLEIALATSTGMTNAEFEVGLRLDGPDTRPKIQSSLQRTHLSTDGGTAGISPQ